MNHQRANEGMHMSQSINVAKMIAATANPASAKSPKGFHLLPTLALALAPAWAAAQTHPLNDTGQTLCYDDSAAVACTTTTHPGQDGRHGRDAANPAKSTDSGGAAGFDFTALDASGAVTTILGSHECVRDNVTGLIWSTQTLGPMDWDTASTALSGYISCNDGSPGWRLPTEGELQSIVNYGARSTCFGGSQCAIDGAYFPNTRSGWYWTSEPYAPDSAVAWIVGFDVGFASRYNKTGTYYVRLVRSGQ
jgi:hypothetical protein